MENLFPEISLEQQIFYWEGAILEDEQVINFIRSKKACSSLKILIETKQGKNSKSSTPSKSTKHTLNINSVKLKQYFLKDSTAATLLNIRKFDDSSLSLVVKYAQLFLNSNCGELPTEEQKRACVAAIIHMFPVLVDMENVLYNKIEHKSRNVRARKRKLQSLQEPGIDNNNNIDTTSGSL